MSAHGGNGRKFSKLEWLAAVRRCKEIAAARRLVIEHIGTTANQDGRNAWRANDIVIDELGVSPETVKRARQDAIKYGLLEVSRPAPRSRGSRKTTEYSLRMPPAANRANSFSGVSRGV